MKRRILKSTLLVCIALFMCHYLCAQISTNDTYYPLVQEGKVWSVVFVTGFIWEYEFSTTQMTFFGDTVINDIQYKKLYASSKEYPTLPHDWTLNSFMREDEDKKVWLKSNSSAEEKLYYDFSLKIGDTIPGNLGLSMPPYYPDEPVIVEDITSISLLNGEERKVWHLSILCGGTPNHKEYWIEGIGSSLGITSPLSGQLNGGFDRLLCVHENNKLVYNDNPWSGKCYISGSLGIEIYNDDQIYIYPNPAKDAIYIEEIDNLDIYAISIINIQGQIIKQFDPSSTLLNVSDIKDGIYFIKLSSSKGDIIKKIIIKKS